MPVDLYVTLHGRQPRIGPAVGSGVRGGMPTSFRLVGGMWWVVCGGMVVVMVGAPTHLPGSLSRVGGGGGGDGGMVVACPRSLSSPGKPPPWLHPIGVGLPPLFKSTVSLSEPCPAFLPNRASCHMCARTHTRTHARRSCSRSGMSAGSSTRCCICSVRISAPCRSLGTHISNPRALASARLL